MADRHEVPCLLSLSPRFWIFYGVVWAVFCSAESGGRSLLRICPPSSMNPRCHALVPPSPLPCQVPRPCRFLSAPLALPLRSIWHVLCWALRQTWARSHGYVGACRIAPGRSVLPKQHVAHCHQGIEMAEQCGIQLPCRSVVSNRRQQSSPRVSRLGSKCLPRLPKRVCYTTH